METNIYRLHCLYYIMIYIISIISLMISYQYLLFITINVVLYLVYIYIIPILLSIYYIYLYHFYILYYKLSMTLYHHDPYLVDIYIYI